VQCPMCWPCKWRAWAAQRFTQAVGANGAARRVCRAKRV